ncbi:MAG: beta-propeller domain-containing protein [Wenzhouxiangellaceae bacterium]
MKSGCYALKSLAIGLVLASLSSACSLVDTARDADPLDGVRFDRLQSVQSERALEEWVTASGVLERRLAQIARTYSNYGCSSLNVSNFEQELVTEPAPEPDSGEIEQSVDLDCVMVTGSRIMSKDMITNVQTADIDEGGLFKRRGDQLFVLRGDRIFRIRIDGPEGPVLQLEQSISLSDSGRVSGVWYDELMVFDEGAAILSFDFERAVTGLQFFYMDSDGYLTPAAHIEIRSEDYYSGSNYGMRLIDGRLLLQVSVGLGDGSRWQWPLWRSVARSIPGSETDGWQAMIDVEDVLLPLIPVSDPVIHTVLKCELDALMLGHMDCAATGLVGELWSELYVSQTAAYVAMDAWKEDAYVTDEFSPWAWGARADRTFSNLVETLIYRLPFDDDEVPGAVFVSGDRGDQFSFREVGSELIVITELQPGPKDRQMAVHRVPLSQFSQQLVSARSPRIETEVLGVSDQHRTIRVADQYVLMGEHGMMVRDTDEPSYQTELVILPLFERGSQRVTLNQSVDSIEPLDDRFFLSGRDFSGQWSMSLLAPNSPDYVATSVVESHDNAEDRSHAFNWRRSSDGTLIMGLPGVLRNEDRDEEYWQESSRVSDFVFLRAEGRRLTPVGVLEMQHSEAPGEDCADQFSCIDWYGNARLAFIGERIFALSTNRLTEARLIDRQIQQVRALLLD